jgi:hypothetical protein
MKKLLIIFIFIIFILFNIIPEDNEKEGFFFYLLDQDGLKNYFEKYNYLVALDKNKVILKEEQIKTFFSEYIGLETLDSLILEAFFRQTKNKTIQRKILKYIKKNNLKDEFSQSLFRFYNSKEKKFKQNDSEQIQYSYNDKYFDENINLFYQYENLVFNKELGLMLFENNWAIISYSNKDDKKNQEEGKNSFFLMYGGGTNSMMINFSRYPDMSFDKFKNEVINDKYNSNKYKKWKTVELEKKHIFENSGADKIFIGYGVGPDIIPEIDSATFSIYLYNEKLKRGYSIMYFMNFSKINNNFKLRHRIWNQILFQLCFTFINITEDT